MKEVISRLQDFSSVVVTSAAEIPNGFTGYSEPRGDSGGHELEPKSVFEMLQVAQVPSL